MITRSGLWQQAELEARVPLLTSATLAERAGAWPEWAIVAATALALGLAVAPGRRRDAGRSSDAGLSPRASARRCVGPGGREGGSTGSCRAQRPTARPDGTGSNAHSFWLTLHIVPFEMQSLLIRSRTV